MTPRIHVRCADEQQEHAGCYAECLVLKVYQKSDKDIPFRSNTVLSRLLYDAALVVILIVLVAWIILLAQHTCWGISYKVDDS